VIQALSLFTSARRAEMSASEAPITRSLSLLGRAGIRIVQSPPLQRRSTSSDAASFLRSMASSSSSVIETNYLPFTGPTLIDRRVDRFLSGAGSATGAVAVSGFDGRVEALHLRQLTLTCFTNLGRDESSCRRHGELHSPISQTPSTAQHPSQP
jgi:hypothetical protein